MSNFHKYANLSPEDRQKLKSYWSELWGEAFANALTEDYQPGGKKDKVEAKNQGKKIEG